MTGRRLSLLLFLATLAPMWAWADEPPPPDPLEGQSAEISGLTFAHQVIEAQAYWHYLGDTLHDTNPLDYYGTWIVLAGCDDKAANCELAKRKGAIGGAVSKINGADVGPDGDVTLLQKAFDAAKASKTGKVTLTLLFAEGTTAPRASKTIVVDFSAR